MHWRIDDVPVFVAVVEQRGISAAANALQMPKSTVSTVISRLEKDLRLRLLDRNSRNVKLTAEGETFYRQALLIMEQVREADAAAAGMNAEPSGRLAVAVPPAFSQEVLAPHLAEFRERFPKVQLDLMVTGAGLELLGDLVDVAVVVGENADSDLICRRLISGQLVWVASPKYLEKHELGARLEQILPHVQICEKRYGMARMPVHFGSLAGHVDLATGINHVTSPLVVREAVAHGAGVSVLPLHYCREAFATGRLVQVCEDVTFDLGASVLSVVYPHRRLVSPRLRVFIDFLVEICSGA
jgi:DNA-binding transcriptional LysR family regulator